jgi:hypothetical protein
MSAEARHIRHAGRRPDRRARVRALAMPIATLLALVSVLFTLVSVGSAAMQEGCD